MEASRSQQEVRSPLGLAGDRSGAISRAALPVDGEFVATESPPPPPPLQVCGRQEMRAELSQY